MAKKKLLVAKGLPRFRTDGDAAHFFDTHDTSEIWQKMKPAPAVKLPARQIAAIRARHDAKKAAISIRLAPDQIAAARKVAAKKSIGYQTQLRMWIAEGIRREARG